MGSEMFEVSVGAFVGALSAFGLEIYRKNRQSISDNANKGNQVIFRLNQNWSSMVYIKSELIDPVRANPGRSILMERMQKIELHDKIEMSSLDFLVDCGYPQTVYEVLHEDERYRTNIRAVNERSEIYLEQVQKPLGKAGVSDGRPLKETELKAIIGERTLMEVSRLADSIISNIDSSIESTMNVQKKLREKLYLACPGRRFIIPDAERE